MTATIFIPIEDTVVTLSAAGSILAGIGACTAGIALGLRKAETSAALLGIWAFGLLLSVLSIAVLDWQPLILSLLTLMAGAANALLAAVIRGIVQRPRYKRQ
jgi:hypothetical protein